MNMLDKSYLEKGITCLCRAMDKSFWVAHFGCAVIAAYYFVEENNLDNEVSAAISDQMDLLMKRYNHLFMPFNIQSPMIATSSMIAERLDGNMGVLRAWGHNVIYASLGMKALNDVPHMKTSFVIDRIVNLVAAFDNEEQGLEWAAENQDDDALQFEPGKDYSDLIKLVLEEVTGFDVLYDCDKHKGQVGHLLTHTHALLDLAGMGYENLTKKGLGPLFSHFQTVRNMRRLNLKVDAPLCVKKTIGPFIPEYWKSNFGKGDGWDYGHTFKFPFSFFHLLNRVGTDPRRDQWVDKFSIFL